MEKMDQWKQKKDTLLLFKKQSQEKKMQEEKNYRNLDKFDNTY